MYVEIHHNTDDDLNAVDKGVLRALLGEQGEATPAPAAKKATPAPAKKTAAAKPEPEPEEEAETPEEESDGTEDLRAEMTAKCTEMVSNGEAKKVKEALTSVGVKKISEVKDEDVAKVLAALG